jgi:NADPH2:quinone reductase
MKAVLMRRFGGPEVLEIAEVPDPTPAHDEVILQVAAVTVNRTLDLVVREGAYQQPTTLPHVLGCDPAGVVVAVGAGVTDRKPGDRIAVSPIMRPANAERGPIILGVSAWGGYAERVKVTASATHLIPDGLDLETAVIIARHAPMALHLLCGKARLTKGETVLVMGATGGLGAAGVQIAKWLGATVIAGAGSPGRVAEALALGADHGIDYRATPLEEAVMALTGGRGVDVVFENIADPDLFPRAFHSLARGGRLVTAGSHGGGVVPLDVTRLYQRQLSVMGSTALTADDVRQSLLLAAQGHLRAEAALRLPLNEAARAHRLLESHEVTGKIVLTPFEPQADMT